ncbi:MAG: alcohol dehydrogenase catalytic domain-containing protein [Deltaproteobacteria bacterium]|nr:alcohol dehydrogenase catalytic domain-containing protein [Deltaproteobacteria bacterium]
MKVSVINKAHEVALEERETPSPGPQEVLVRMRAMGICGTDLHVYEGGHPVVTFPHIPFHEMSGEVASTGAGAEDLRPGQHVVVEPVIECGRCYSCRIGIPHNCFQLQFRGIHVDGGGREYMVVPRHKLYPVPDDWPHEKAALAEPLGIGLESAHTADLILGDTVAVFGAGPIGLAVLLAAKQGGHRTLIFDIEKPCLNRARALGADEAVNLRQTDPLEAIRDFTKGEGANVVVEASGKASNFPLSVEGVSICGRVVIAGLILEEVSLVPFTLIRKRISLRGTRNSNKIPQAIELLKERPEIAETFITHRLPISRVKEGFELLLKRPEDICKIMLLWD